MNRSQVIAAIALALAACAPLAARAAEAVIPVDEELARMDQEALASGFKTALLKSDFEKTLAPAAAYLRALRLRFPELEELPALESEYAESQLAMLNADRPAAYVVFERFLPGGPYANSGMTAYLARDTYAMDLALNQRLDEGMALLRQNVELNAGGVRFSRGALIALRQLFDLRLLLDESDRADLLRFCMAELQRILDAAAQDERTGGTDVPAEWAALHAARARLAQRFGDPELKNCVDALAPTGDPARLRADLISHFRLAEAYAKHDQYHPDRQDHYAQAAGLCDSNPVEPVFRQPRVGVRRR